MSKAAATGFAIYHEGCAQHHQPRPRHNNLVRRMPKSLTSRHIKKELLHMPEKTADTKCGGWTSFQPLNAQAKDVFQKATQGLLGVKRTPLLVATQVVSGMNYCFLCNSQVVSPGAAEHSELVYVYAPISGAPHITAIKPLSH